jgi:cytidylate kinase
MIVAIDGPAASGKGTLGLRLAEYLKLPHLDTGLLYRATALQLLDQGQALGDVEAAATAARGLALTDLSPARLRGRAIGEAASIIAAYKDVREALHQVQSRFAQRPEGAILDGRDIGTVICPQADVKIFVTASPEARAARRTLELQARGENVDYAQVLADIRQRDERDISRSTAPLQTAPDAVVLDTTELDIEEVFEKALSIVESWQKLESLEPKFG